MPDPKISKAVILAAGRGKRMGTMTEEMPKPMLPIHGRPMLELVLSHLAEAGVRRFLVVIGYRGETIEEHFASTKTWDVEFLRQDPVNGTGSAALLARKFVSDDNFLLTYGDIICEPSAYLGCTKALAATDATVASIGVKAVDDPWQGAAVYDEGGRITRIIEKPPKGTSTTRWNSAGLYAFRPRVFDYLEKVQPSPRGEYELTSALDSMLTDGLDLRLCAVEGEWRDVGRPEDLAAMNS